MTCKETKDGKHAWALIDAIQDNGSKEKVWVCPCGNWKRLELNAALEATTRRRR